MSWHLIFSLLTIFVVASTSFRIVRRSPEEHVPHEGRFEETDELGDYPPLRGIEPALPPHLRYLEAPSTDFKLTRRREGNIDEFIPVNEERSASGRKLIEDNSTFDVTSGNITINDQARAITENFGGEGLDFNTTQTFGTTLPETLITMKASPIQIADFVSLTSTKRSSIKRNSSNRQSGRSLSVRQPISKATTIRYVSEANRKRDERSEELPENVKSEEKLAKSRNENSFDPLQLQQNTETKASTQLPEKVSTTTENQDDVVDGFMNRIQDHWIQFVQQMKHSVMDVWQTITSRIMNSLENFSLSTH